VYKVVFTKQAYKALRKAPRHVVSRIRQKLDQVAENPYGKHANVIKLQGRSGYRLRVGDWRVIYEIQDDQVQVLVLKIGSRGEIYR
jgi:mRNA interferase RelE/StbE